MIADSTAGSPPTAIALVLAALLVCGAPQGGARAARAEQAEQAATAATASAPAGRAAGIVSFPHLQLDLRRRRIVIEAEVCAPQYMLEFLLCRRGTKEYESLLATDARAGDVHAALLALGLRPGKPGRWSGDEQTAKFLPPAGAEVAVTLRWTGPQGPQEVPAGQWLAGASGKPARSPQAWVFVGSQVLPDGQYLADLATDGGIVAVGNVPSAVLDGPFVSGTALEAREFVADPKAVPPPGTAVQVILTPLPGAEKAEHARAMLEIDPLGRMRIEGAPVEGEQLSQWAQDYLAAHAKGDVVIRLAAEALVDDLRRAREALQAGGVRDIEEVFLPPDLPVLPRTDSQLRQAMEQWRQRLAGPEQYVLDPAQEAQQVLRQIRDGMERCAAMAALWRQYAQELSAELTRRQSATQPAEKPGAAGK